MPDILRPPSSLALPFTFTLTITGQVQGMTEHELARALPTAISVAAWLTPALTGIVVDVEPMSPKGVT